jgi:hypothetical protein
MARRGAAAPVRSCNISATSRPRCAGLCISATPNPFHSIRSAQSRSPAAVASTAFACAIEGSTVWWLSAKPSSRAFWTVGGMPTRNGATDSPVATAGRPMRWSCMKVWNIRACSVQCDRLARWSIVADKAVQLRKSMCRQQFCKGKLKTGRKTHSAVYLSLHDHDWNGAFRRLAPVCSFRLSVLAGQRSTQAQLPIGVAAARPQPALLVSIHGMLVAYCHSTDGVMPLKSRYPGSLGH